MRLTVVFLFLLILVGCSPVSGEYVVEINSGNREIPAYENLKEGDKITLVLEFDKGNYSEQEFIEVVFKSYENKGSMFTVRHVFKIVATDKEMNRLNKATSFRIEVNIDEDQ